MSAALFRSARRIASLLRGPKHRTACKPLRAWLAVDALERRDVPAGSVNPTTSLTAGAHQTAKAVLATTPGQLQNLDRAAASASSLAALAHSTDSQAGKTTGPEIAVDGAGSDTAWVNSLLQQINGSSGTSGKDPLEKLVQWEEITNPNLKPNEAIQQAEHLMGDLAAALRAAGVSDHDIHRLLGGAGDSTPSASGASSASTIHGMGGGSSSSSQGGGGKMPSQQEIDNSPFLTAVFGRDDGSTDWVAQMPFLSVTQGQNPIQVGSATQGLDPRTAAPQIDPQGKAQGVYGSGSGQFIVWKNSDGTRVVVPPLGGSKESSTTNDGRFKLVVVKDRDKNVSGLVIIPLKQKGADAVVVAPTKSGGDDDDGDGMDLPKKKDDGKTKLPAPDDVGLGNHSGDPAPIRDLGGQVELRDPDHSGAKNIDKLVGSIVGHVNSKVNPAPDSGGHDEATSVGNGYHVGISPPEYDVAHANTNAHPGVKPSAIIIGVGPGPKAN